MESAKNAANAGEDDAERGTRPGANDGGGDDARMPATPAFDEFRLHLYSGGTMPPEVLSSLVVGSSSTWESAQARLPPGARVPPASFRSTPWLNGAVGSTLQACASAANSTDQFSAGSHTGYGAHTLQHRLMSAVKPGTALSSPGAGLGSHSLLIAPQLISPRAAQGTGPSGTVPASTGTGADGSSNSSDALSHLITRPTAASALQGKRFVAAASSWSQALLLTATGDVYQWRVSGTAAMSDAEEGGAGGEGDAAASFETPVKPATTGAAAGGASAAAAGLSGMDLGPMLVHALTWERALRGVRVVAVACGPQHCVALTSAPTCDVYTWGCGSDGRLGHGSEADEVVPRLVLALVPFRVTSVAAGGAHTAAITMGQLDLIDLEAAESAEVDKQLRVAGYGVPHKRGSLDDGDDSGGEPVHLNARGAAVKHQRLAASMLARHRQAKSSEDRLGMVWTWGRGRNGRLGHGDQSSVLVPKRVSGIVRVRQRMLDHAGGSSTPNAALEREISNGSVSGDGTPVLVPPSASHSTGVGDDGATAKWVPGSGFRRPPSSAQVAEKAKAAAAVPAVPMDEYEAARIGGTVGARLTSSAATPLGNGYPSEMRRAASSGGAASNRTTSLTVERGICTQVSCGRSFTVAVTADGDVWTWGRGAEGQCGVQLPALLHVAITQKLASKGENTAAASSINSAGDLLRPHRVVFPSPQYHQPAHTVAAAARAAYQHMDPLTRMLTCPWTLQEPERQKPRASRQGDDSEADTESAHEYTEGEEDRDLLPEVQGVNPVYWATSAAGGELGDDSPRVVRVSAGHSHVIACTRDGHVWAWGSNTFGQVGASRLNTEVPAPAHIPVHLYLQAAYDQMEHDPHREAVTAAVEEERRRMRAYFGGGKRPRSTVSLGDDPVLTVQAGAFHTVIGTASGVLMAWGRNAEGQLGVGDTVIHRGPELMQPQVRVQVTAVPDDAAASAGDTTDAAVSPKAATATASVLTSPQPATIYTDGTAATPAEKQADRSGGAEEQESTVIVRVGRPWRRIMDLTCGKDFTLVLEAAVPRVKPLPSALPLAPVAAHAGGAAHDRRGNGSGAQGQRTAPGTVDLPDSPRAQARGAAAEAADGSSAPLSSEHGLSRTMRTNTMTTLPDSASVNSASDIGRVGDSSYTVTHVRRYGGRTGSGLPRTMSASGGMTGAHPSGSSTAHLRRPSDSLADAAPDSILGEGEAGAIRKLSLLRASKRLAEETKTAALSQEWEQTVLGGSGGSASTSASPRAAADAAVFFAAATRQGLPAHLRCRLWPLAIGNALRITPAQFDMYRHKAQAALSASNAAMATGRSKAAATAAKGRALPPPVPVQQGHPISSLRDSGSINESDAGAALMTSRAGSVAEGQGSGGAEKAVSSRSKSPTAHDAGKPTKVLNTPSRTPSQAVRGASTRLTVPQSPRGGAFAFAGFSVGREDTVSLIPMDLLRTFPMLHLFGPPNTASEGPLYRLVCDVLEAFAFYRPDLGYVQGMSYITAMLALHIAGTTVLAAPGQDGSLDGTPSRSPASVRMSPATPGVQLQRGSSVGGGMSTPTAAVAAEPAASPASKSQASLAALRSSASALSPLTAMLALSNAGTDGGAGEGGRGGGGGAGGPNSSPTGRQAASNPLSVADDRYIVFQALANLMARHHLYVFFAMDPGPLVPYYDLFDQLLAQRRPALAAQLANCCVQTEMFLFPWFQTLFLKMLPLDAAARVWDGFLVAGVPHLYRTALGIMDLLAPALTTPSASFEDVVQILTQAPGYQHVWDAILSDGELLQRAVENVVLPEGAMQQLEELVADPFFYRQVGGPRIPGMSASLTNAARAAARGDFAPRSPEAIRNF